MDVIEEVRKLVKPEYDKLGCWIHKWQHIEEVVDNSIKLSGLENLSDEIAKSSVIAAYCHDLGRIEEEERHKRKESPLPHSLLSIEPTIQVLQQVGISGVDFNEVVEAVAVHSYKDYFGKNIVAQILRDADKLSGVYSGIMCATRDFVGRDYMNNQEIIRNWKDKKKVKEFSDYTLEHLESDIDADIIKKMVKQLDWIIEYKDMFHTKSALILAKEGLEWMQGYKDYLIKRFNLTTTSS